MPETSVDTEFAFQPLINLHTGGVVAMEMLARPAHRDVQSLYRCAADAGQLEKLDVTLAVAAAHCSSAHETLLPLHLNLMADTIVAEGEMLAPLHEALRGTARQPSQTVLEINPTDTALKPGRLVAGVRRLRRLGYRIALDGVGAGSYPLTVITKTRPDLIKVDREIVAGLPGESSCVTVLEALLHLAPRIGAQVVAEGVDRPEQLALLRRYGVAIAQGNLLGPPDRRPLIYPPVSAIAACRRPVSANPTRGRPGERTSSTVTRPTIPVPISAPGRSSALCSSA